MNLLTLSRPPRGEHRRTPEAWALLMEDLDGCAQTNREMEQELAEQATELGVLRERLAQEQKLRGYSDALIGSLVRQRDHHARAHRYAQELLAVALHGDTPAPPTGDEPEESEPEVEQDCADTVPMPLPAVDVPVPEVVRLGSSAWATPEQIAALRASVPS